MIGGRRLVSARLAKTANATVIQRDFDYNSAHIDCPAGQQISQEDKV